MHATAGKERWLCSSNYISLILKRCRRMEMKTSNRRAGVMWGGIFTCFSNLYYPQDRKQKSPKLKINCSEGMIALQLFLILNSPFVQQNNSGKDHVLIMLFPFLFQGIIDYIFYSKPQLNILGILGPLDHHWLIENNISGCPHPLIPSDHFSLFAQLELLLPFLPPVNGIHLPGRRQLSTFQRVTSIKPVQL